MQPAKQSIRNYFVDEAGDGQLFKDGGKVAVGTPGCSRWFILGLLSAFAPADLERDFTELRVSMLKDPKFNTIPSFNPNQRKTALAFHAKDDHPSVREQVFKVLTRQKFRFFAVVKDKLQSVTHVLSENLRVPGYKYKENHLYEHLVRVLFQGRLHGHNVSNICFAKRGMARAKTFRDSLLRNQEYLKQRSPGSTFAELNVVDAYPAQRVCLQAVDYCTWALQRLFERADDSYAKMIWPLVSSVRDIDDVAANRAGVFYTKENMPTVAQIRKRLGI